VVKRIIIIAGCLAGCSSSPTKETKEATPVVQVVTNGDKDAYITKVESEVAEAGAALRASLKSDPVHRPLVELTVTRLSGISQPTASKVDEYAKAQIDPKSMQAEKDRAAKVNDETNALWAKVESKDKENQGLRDAMKVMEARHKQEAEEKRLADMMEDITTTCQWIGSIVLLAGVILMVAGSLLGKPSKAGGLCIIVGGGVILLPILLPTVLTEAWFGYAVGGILIIAIGWAMWDARSTHAEVASRCRVNGSCDS
jgi:hypothetical protein